MIFVESQKKHFFFLSKSKKKTTNMYCHACEHEHEDDYPKCVATEETPTISPDIQRALDIAKQLLALKLNENFWKPPEQRQVTRGHWTRIEAHAPLEFLGDMSPSLTHLSSSSDFDRWVFKYKDFPFGHKPMAVTPNKDVQAKSL